MIKSFIKVIIRNLLKVFYILPIKKQILFESFQGKSICCNPYYIFKEIEKSNIKIIWTYNFDPSDGMNNKNVTYVKFHTFKWFLASIQSKVIVNNDAYGSWVPYRKKQILINTWHGGGAYKRVGNDNNEFTFDKNETNKNLYFSKITKYFVSSGKLFSEVISKSFFLDKKVLVECGMPRNDIFFDIEKMKAANVKIRNLYNFFDSDFIILYAPTFRGGENNKFLNDIDFSRLRNCVKDWSGKNVKILFRGHHAMKSQSFEEQIDYDVSKYPDMQELLCASDMLITDYSSTMWDFSLTYKPCILFTPDIDEYIEKRGLYTDPKNWGFPIAKDNDELEKVICEFNNQKYKLAMDKKHKFFGSYENGNATKIMCDLILKNF